MRPFFFWRRVLALEPGATAVILSRKSKKTATPGLALVRWPV